MIDEQDRETIPFEELEHRAVMAEQKAREAKKKLLSTVGILLSTALDALSARVRVIFSVALMATIFAFSMYEPTILRVVAATIFGGLLIVAGMFKDGGDNAR